MLDQYRSDYVAFCGALMREYYLHYSGQKDDLELAPLYDRYGDLFTKDRIAATKRNLEQTSEHFESQRAALRKLLLFATEQFLENSAKQLTEEISQYEGRASIKLSGRRMTFQESAVAIMTERDRDTRRSIYKKRIAVIAHSNDLRSERLLRAHEAARQLGYSSYRALFEELRQIDYLALARESEHLIERTESVYAARLDEALSRHLGLRLGEAQRPDAYYFLHHSGYDDRFPAERLLRVYEETMSGLGISINAQKNILIDSEKRPRKSPRAFCAPISIPDEIKLVIRPVGGQSDYQAFFHESGHAQHYAWTSAALTPEFKYTGDYALTETYAFLFDHLILESAWLSSMLDFGNNEEFIRSLMLARLVTVRRYAAKFIYERRLHESADPASASDFYAETQTRAIMFETGPEEFLFDLDDSFYSANYLRAWAMEVALREHLKEKFGRAWWTSARAGNFLKEIWETGDRYTADEMAAEIGLGPIGFDLLIDEFNRALK